MIASDDFSEPIPEIEAAPRRLTIHTLQSWRDDVETVVPCSACGREIRAGDRYCVPRGTIKLVCLPCARTPQPAPAPLPKPRPPRPERVRRERRGPAPVRALRPPAPGPKPRGHVACAWCQSTFLPYRRADPSRARLYCSAECRAEKNRARMRSGYARKTAPTPVIDCPTCNQPFKAYSTGRGGRKKVCSAPCRQDGARPRHYKDRRAILAQLSTDAPKTAVEIAAAVAMSAKAVRKALWRLRIAGGPIVLLPPPHYGYLLASPSQPEHVP